MGCRCECDCFSVMDLNDIAKSVPVVLSHSYELKWSDIQFLILRLSGKIQTSPQVCFTLVYFAATTLYIYCTHCPRYCFIIRLVYFFHHTMFALITLQSQNSDLCCINKLFLNWWFGFSFLVGNRCGSGLRDLKYCWRPHWIEPQALLPGGCLLNCFVLVDYMAAILSSPCVSYGLAKPVYRFPHVSVHLVLCLFEVLLVVILS